MDVHAVVAEELAVAAAEVIAAFVPRSGVCPGSGGGRESNPPATRSAARRF
jgi:hypothetical protein